MISELKFIEGQSVRGQITEFLREAVLTGKLQPGDRLPSTQELARKWGASEANVHHAMVALVKEGFIKRTSRVGTIVNDLPKALQRVIVYIKQLDHPDAAFGRILCKMLEKELCRRNIDMILIQDDSRQSGLDELASMAKRRSIQGIIAPQVDSELLESLKKMPVPFTHLGTGRSRDNVRIDDASMVKQAIDGLKKQGCRTAGAILSIRDFVPPRSSSQKTEHAFFLKLRAGLEANGIDIRNEWIITPRHQLDLGSFTHYSFDAFNRLWNRPDCPEGLFVYTEDLITGVLMGVLSHQIHVPEQLKLVMHHNAENEILCPVPAYFVECRIMEIARSLIDRFECLFYGKKVQKDEIPFRLRWHDGTASHPSFQEEKL